MDLALLVGSSGGAADPYVQRLIAAEAHCGAGTAWQLDDVVGDGIAGRRGLGDEGQGGVLCGARLWAGHSGGGAPGQRPVARGNVGLLGPVSDERHVHRTALELPAGPCPVVAEESAQ